MSKKELATLKDTPPIIVIRKSAKLEYYKDELKRLNNLEKDLSKMVTDYERITKDYKELKRAGLQDRQQLELALTELNLLKPLRILVKYTLQCPQLKKEISFIECNRGIHLSLCGKNSCETRENLYADLKLVY